MVDFCGKIVVFSQKSLLSQLATPLTSLLDKDFQSFEATIRQWSSMIEKRVTFLASESQLQTAGRVREMLLSSAKAESQRHRKRKLQVLRSLCSTQMQYDLAWRRQRKKGTARWVLGEGEFRAWRTSNGSSTLSISGKLGCGKSVLMATIVGDLHGGSPATLRNEPSGPALPGGPAQDIDTVASFFCQYNIQHSLEARSIIGSIAHQMLAVLDPGSESMRSAADIVLASDSLTTDDIVHVLTSSYPGDFNTFVIVDAIDECPPREAAIVFEAMGRLVEHRKIRFCFSSRIGSPASEIAADHIRITHHISMTGLAMESELVAFVESEIESRRKIRQLPPALETLVKETLAKAANGM